MIAVDSYRLRAPAFLAILVMAVVAAGAAGAAGAQRMPLRQVDWNAALLADPHITPIADCPPFPFAELGPCIEVAADDAGLPGNFGGDQPVGSVIGYAATAPGDVLYGDLDGDGIDEAVIRVESGGTAGTIGMLLYREGEPRPELVLVRAGYKLFPRIEDGRLVLWEPFYFGFEGNCCPTGAYQVAYRLTGNALQLIEIPGESPLWLILGERERPATFAEVTVVAFYRALQAGRFEEAYTFLSPDFQAANPYPEWRAGFATTRSIEVETQPGLEFTDDRGRSVYEVLVRLIAVDATAGGGTVTRRFAGVWLLVKGTPPGYSLRLDSAQIGLAP